MSIIRNARPVATICTLILGALVTAAPPLLLGGCASPPPQPESMRDPQANFNAYKTFGWSAGNPADPAADQPLLLLDSNIRAAIRTQLTRRGYVEAPDGAVPDLRIVYETTKAEKIENNPVQVGVGVGHWGGNVGGSINVGSPSLHNFTEGKLVVHAIDTARNAEAWQGSVSGRVTKGSVTPEAVAAAVATVFKDFPARSAPH